MNFKGMKKIWRVIERIILVYLICGLAFSLGYAQFCTDKIQAREQYLQDVSGIILPPKDAVFKEEYMIRKLVIRKYYLIYMYNQSGNRGIKYYKDELAKHGYSLKKLKESEIEATNGDILIRIRYDEKQKELVITIMFDDIFTKIG